MISLEKIIERIQKEKEKEKKKKGKVAKLYMLTSQGNKNENGHRN